MIQSNLYSIPQPFTTYCFQEGVQQDRHRHRDWFRYHGVHRVLRQAHPHPHQQHHRRGLGGGGGDHVSSQNQFRNSFFFLFLIFLSLF